MSTLREWLSEGPFTLAMSSGFFGFFAHAGVMSVLEEEQLFPARVAGSSAGALVGGLWAAGVPPRTICKQFVELRREHFWDVGLGFGLLRGALFRSILESLLQGRTFEECRVPLAISAFDLGARRTAVLRSGAVAPALHASCALPLMFQPVRIGQRLYLDGGILDRPGLHGVKEGERVLHHHLLSRPPWRLPNSAALRKPARPNLKTVAIDALPRVNPFWLERGVEAPQQHAMPALTRDGLVEHALVICVLDEQVVDARRLVQFSAEAVDAPLPLLEPGRVPLEIEVDQVSTVAVEVDAFGADVGRNENPRRQGGGEGLGDHIALTARVVPGKRRGEWRPGDRLQYRHRSAPPRANLVREPGISVELLVFATPTVRRLFVGADEVQQLLGTRLAKGRRPSRSKKSEPSVARRKAVSCRAIFFPARFRALKYGSMAARRSSRAAAALFRAALHAGVPPSSP